jgi:hypothetical protein
VARSVQDRGQARRRLLLRPRLRSGEDVTPPEAEAEGEARGRARQRPSPEPEAEAEA